MAREMTPEEIEAFIADEFVARLGCHAGGATYVVPVAYAYRDGSIYAFSHEGKKIRMMRTNPNVSVEIDSVLHLGSWRSVILSGTFEELCGRAAEEGAEIATQRLGSVIDDPESRRRLEEAFRDDAAPVVFRIVITEKSGRVEGA